MDRNIIQKILIGLFLLTCIFIGLRAFNVIDFNDNVSKSIPNANVSSSQMTYGRFLEYLEMGWVKQVDFYYNGRNAIVQASSPELGNRPQSIQVEIPVGASQLIDSLLLSLDLSVSDLLFSEMLSSCLLTLRSTDDCSGSYMIRLPEVGSIDVFPRITLS